MTPLSQAIIAAIHQLKSENRYMPPADLKAGIIDSLIFTFQVYCASEDVFSLAATRLEAGPGWEGDMHGYFAQRLAAVTGSAAQLKEDMRLAGVDANQYPLIPTAVELAGSQYYLTRHCHPSALLGFLAFVECTGATNESLEVLEETLGGHKLEAIRKSIAEAGERNAQLQSLIDRSPAHHQQLIFGNAVRSATLLFAASHRFGCGVERFGLDIPVQVGVVSDDVPVALRHPMWATIQ